MGANVTPELLLVAKVISAKSFGDAKSAIVSHFADADADVGVLETALKIAGVFFAPAAQAETDIEIAYALYKVLKAAGFRASPGMAHQPEGPAGAVQL